MKKFWIWEEILSDAEHFTSENLKTLFKILNDNSETIYGKKYNFNKIKTIEDFRKNVPLTEYDHYYDYIKRILNKEKNILFSYNIRYLTETSGTTGHKKLFPMTDELIDIFDKYAHDGIIQMIEKRLGTTLNKCFLLSSIRPNSLNGFKVVLAGQTMYERFKDNNKDIFNFFTSPMEVIFPEKDTDVEYLRLLFALAEPDLDIIFGHFGYQFLMVFLKIKKIWKKLVKDIENGKISEDVSVPIDIRNTLNKKLKPNINRAKELYEEFNKGFDDPIIPRIFKKLKIVVFITGDTFQSQQIMIKKLIGNTPVHSFAYVSTEGLYGV